MAAKLSYTQRKVLTQAAQGQVTWRDWRWCDKPFGGFNVTSTVKSLVRRGLLDDGPATAVLTDAGRALLDALNPNPEA